ncbi:MAG: response regulator [Myxococcales bacterium FL481]|nr:MAG: response regulator [Myxococcales bacterium FL481]
MHRWPAKLFEAQAPSAPVASHRSPRSGSSGAQPTPASSVRHTLSAPNRDERGPAIWTSGPRRAPGLVGGTVTLKILIADDDSTTRRILTRAIALLGHEVSAVGDGRELVRRFGETRPDLVLTDWHMPEMNGVTAIEHIRRLPGGSDVFIILATGVYGAAETANAIEAGADDYILKPISVPALRVLLMLSGERILRRRSTGTSRRGWADSDSRWTPEAGLPGIAASLDGQGCVRSVAPADNAEWAPELGASVLTAFTSSDQDVAQDALAAAAQGATRCFVHRSGPDQTVRELATLWPVRYEGNVTGFRLLSVPVKHEAPWLCDD